MGPITPFVYPSFHPINLPPPLFLLFAPALFPSSSPLFLHTSAQLRPLQPSSWVTLLLS